MNTTTSSPDLSPETILAYLTQHFPNGATFLNGEITERPKAVKVQNLTELAVLARKPQTLTFEFRNQMMAIEVRGLTGDEAAEVDKIPDPVAPMKKVPGKGGSSTEQYDFRDPEYLVKVQQAYELKRAALIAFGLVGMDIPGGSIDEKAAWLRTQFPPQLLELFGSKIRSLTSNDIEMAAFV